MHQISLWHYILFNFDFFLSLFLFLINLFLLILNLLFFVVFNLFVEVLFIQILHSFLFKLRSSTTFLDALIFVNYGHTIITQEYVKCCLVRVQYLLLSMPYRRSLHLYFILDFIVPPLISFETPKSLFQIPWKIFFFEANLLLLAKSILIDFWRLVLSAENIKYAIVFFILFLDCCFFLLWRWYALLTLFGWERLGGFVSFLSWWWRFYRFYRFLGGRVSSASSWRWFGILSGLPVPIWILTFRPCRWLCLCLCLWCLLSFTYYNIGVINNW